MSNIDSYIITNLSDFGWDYEKTIQKKSSHGRSEDVLIFNKGLYSLTYQKKFDILLIQRHSDIVFKGKISNIEDIKIIERMVVL